MPDEPCPETRKPAPAGVHLWLVLTKAHQAIGRLAAGRRRGSCLGESEFRVLEVLLHEGALPVNVIGPKVDLTPGSISVAVDRLHSRGLVSRTEDPDDRRVRRVDLTAQGRQVIEAVFCRHASDLEEVMGPLCADERTQLVDSLRKIAPPRGNPWRMWSGGVGVLRPRKARANCPENAGGKPRRRPGPEPGSNSLARRGWNKASSGTRP